MKTLWDLLLTPPRMGRRVGSGGERRKNIVARQNHLSPPKKCISQYTLSSEKAAQRLRHKLSIFSSFMFRKMFIKHRFLVGGWKCVIWHFPFYLLKGAELILSRQRILTTLYFALSNFGKIAIFYGDNNNRYRSCLA